jgi:hypothetical protein
MRSHIWYRQKERVEGIVVVCSPFISWREGGGEGNVWPVVKEAVTYPFMWSLLSHSCCRQKVKVEGVEVVSFPFVSWRDGGGEGNV